nr:hypothetical protein GCM10025732_42710 [Glycomyces mayteni]
MLSLVEQPLDLRADLGRVEAADGEGGAAAEDVVGGFGPLHVAGVDDLRPDLGGVRVDALGELRVLPARRAMSKAMEP